MQINSVEFIQGIVPGEVTWDVTIPQVVLYGRSNAGKSSTVNLFTGKKIARTSDVPGRTQEANLFLINKSGYLIDMPGYGYAKASKVARESISNLIHWFIHNARVEQRTNLLIVDSKIGLTDSDKEILQMLIDQGEIIFILLNKIDRINQSDLSKILKQVRSEVPDSIEIVPFSSKTGKGKWKGLLERF